MPMHNQTEKVLAVWQEPFSLGSPHIEMWTPGMSVSQIVDKMTCLPDTFPTQGVVQINGEEVPKALWGMIKPKADSLAKPVAVTLHMPLKGSKESRKQVFALVAAIALSIFTAGIAGGSAAALFGPSFAAGEIGAQLLAGAVSLVGALIIGALTAPPATLSDAGGQGIGQALGAGSASGNLLEPNGAIPRVIGKRRMFPPFVQEPIIELKGQDEEVNAIYALAGPHALRDFRLGDTTIEPELVDQTDVTMEFRQGFPGDALLDLNERQGKTFQYGFEMSRQQVSADDPTQIVDVSNTLPVWHGVGTRFNPDEIWVHFAFAGIIVSSASTTDLMVPIRCRLRLRGSTTWRYLPEFMYRGNNSGQQRTQIKLLFGNYPDSIPANVPTTQAFATARTNVPGQAVSPLGPDFDADPYFHDGIGDDYIDSSNIGSTGVQNLNFTDDALEVLLDTTSWPKGNYEVEFMRGASVTANNFVLSSYQTQGSVRDLFTFFGTGTIPYTRANMADTLNLIRSVNIWNEYPVKQASISLISITARNRAVDKLSVEASGFVRDYGGVELPATLDSSLVPETLLGSYSLTERQEKATFRCSVVFSKEPTEGYIWEAAGVTVGSLLAYDGTQGKMVLRAGSGTIGLFNSDVDTAILNIPSEHLPWDGEAHELIWHIDVVAGTVQLWIDKRDFGVGTTTDGSSLDSDLWAGASDASYLHDSPAAIPGYASMVSWDRTDASDLDQYFLDQDVDVSGALWDIFAETSNPAAWYSDVLIGSLNYDPLPPALLDNDSLIEWRQTCIQEDYTCDLITSGIGIIELLRLLASCGWARPAQSNVWGVIQDYDRSAEDPVQLLTPRNSSGFSWTKAFARLPAGLRITFAERALAYSQSQVNVFREGAIGTSNALERITYEGFVNEDKVVKRGKFDILQGRLRATFYNVKMPFEWIRFKRGSLVGITYDAFRKQYETARILSTTVVSGDITEIILDQEVTIISEESLDQVVDLTLVEDMTLLGLDTGIAIRDNAGDIRTFTISNSPGTTNTLTLTTPIADDQMIGSNLDLDDIPVIGESNLVAIGFIGSEYKRLIVMEIAPLENLEADIVLVDEAPELWQS